MARIGKEALERLKQNISLVRLVEASGVVLEKRGKDHVGCCPFHEDKTPSLVISPQKNLWHCMGACDAGGDVIEWVRRIEGVSFRHAVELLANDYAPDLDLAARGPIKQATVPKLESFDAAGNNELALQVVNYYHETLKADTSVHDWLAKRGLGCAELIDTFKLGLSNRTLGYRLPQANRKAGKEQRGRLQQIGLMRESGHEHFAGSLVVPVFDGAGRLVEAYGRKLLDNLRKGTPKHLYLPGPHAGVWNREAVAASDEVILCEALLDAMTFWAAGYRNVTASYGTGGFTDDHLALFTGTSVKRVLIAYDRDAAGDSAAEKLASKLMENGIDCYRVQFPKGMDANEYACQVKPARESLGVLLRSAEWLGTGGPVGQSGKAPTRSASTEQAENPAKAAKEGAEAQSVAASSISEPASAPEAVVDEIVMPPSEFIPLAATPRVATPRVAGNLAASPVPEVQNPVAAIDAEISEHEIGFTFGERYWRVRGMARNLSYEALKLNILVRQTALTTGVVSSAKSALDGCSSEQPEADKNLFHVDTLDLYAARQRAAFVTQASKELGVSAEVIKSDLSKLLLKLEALQEEQIADALKPKEAPPYQMSEQEHEAALAYLKTPDLIERIGWDIEAAGVVGEGANGLVAYLASVSRKLEKPLAILIQSTSAAGKSVLMDTVLSLMPEEERVAYSAMTGQSLYYLGEMSLRHKILAIAEEEGVREASYALKLLQSQGELTIASTGKDAATGKLVTQEYHLEGPVVLMLTTTAIDLDEELANRCLVLTINETRAQTRLIHDRQRFEETLEGLQAKEHKRSLLTLHQNMQRLLEPLQVVNPFATRLTFLDEKTRTRRDHQKYLALIRSIALLHQHQRPIRYLERSEGEPIAYIEATEADITIANRLAHTVLGRTLDELPPQTRSLLTLIDDWVAERCKSEVIKRSDYRFSRRDVREATGWGNTQLKVHLKRLEELEYLIVHRGGRGQSFVYELVYSGEGKGGQSFLVGLIDTVKQAFDANKSGSSENWSGVGRPQVGAVSVGGRGDETAGGAELSMVPADPLTIVSEGTVPPEFNGHTSDTYVQVAAPSVSSLASGN